MIFVNFVSNAFVVHTDEFTDVGSYQIFVTAIFYSKTIYFVCNLYILDPCLNTIIQENQGFSDMYAYVYGDEVN